MWNHTLLQWQGAKVVSTVPVSGVQNHFLWEAGEETCRRWKMVNEVILAKVQGFLLGMPIVVFSNTPTTMPLKAYGRIFISFKRSQVKHVKLYVWVKHKHLSQGFGVLCVCVYKSNVALLHCVIPDVLSHLEYSNKTEIFEVCKCYICRHFEPRNFSLGLCE